MVTATTPASETATTDPPKPSIDTGKIRSDRLVVMSCMLIAIRPLRGTPFAGPLSALMLGALIFLAIDGLRRGWLLAMARRVDQLMWVAMAWAVAVVAITGPGAELTTIMVSFFFGTLLACRIAACVRPTETLALSMVAVVLASLLLSPWQVVDQTGGLTWAFEHKNAAGRVLGLAAVILVGRRLTDPRQRFASLFLATGVVALGMVFLTDSGTVLLASVASIGFVWFNRRKTPEQRNGTSPMLAIAAALAVVAVSVLLIGIIGWDPAATASRALGRSTTDNTAIVRFGLWADGVRKIFARPFFGYGYTPYDRGNLVFSSGRNIARDFDPTNLHNSYLQLAYSFGVTFALITVGHTFRRMWQNYQAGLTLRTALALCMGFYGFSYSVFFAGSTRASIYWALSMWAIYIVPASLLDGQSPQLGAAHRSRSQAGATGAKAKAEDRTGVTNVSARRDVPAELRGPGPDRLPPHQSRGVESLIGLEDTTFRGGEFSDVDLIVDDSDSAPRITWPPLPVPGEDHEPHLDRPESNHGRP